MAGDVDQMGDVSLVCLVPGVPGDEADGLHLLCHPWPLTLAVLAWETLHLLLLSPHLRQSWNGTSRASVKHLTIRFIMNFSIFITFFTTSSSPTHPTSHFPQFLPSLSESYFLSANDFMICSFKHNFFMHIFFIRCVKIELIKESKGAVKKFVLS